MNYRHLSIEERSCIRKYYVDGLSYYLVKGNLKVLRRKGKSHGVKETRGKYSKGKSIRKRDKSVYSRQEAGHWEADTVVSGQGKSKACFATLAERKTRFYIAVKLPDKKAGTMENAIVSALSAFPACAPIRWAVVVGLSCLSTPFLWCLPKETAHTYQAKKIDTRARRC